jgi:hypothetical protein
MGNPFRRHTLVRKYPPRKFTVRLARRLERIFVRGKNEKARRQQRRAFSAQDPEKRGNSLIIDTLRLHQPEINSLAEYPDTFRYLTPL